ncbi:SRPBCC family protein [Dysgonomonas sp. 216]|uniref:SRPBCC family protein n=1 Tax=Dysgonomonas sp. 216 TaxID=2302934 RepID=UPI0013D09D90|nr:SRPBCC family protein [Dysgonomonas sp. 216]NDW19327.1 SRPBCC family protein [Dysgonomonas sp. 216]
MAEFYSEEKKISYPNSTVYNVFSDMRNLEALKEKMPEDDRLKGFSYEEDSCSISVDPVGKIKFNIVERTPNSLIKFEAEQVPFALSLSILLEQTSTEETTMKVGVVADLNPFIKPMVSKPLQQAIDKIADMMASIPFDEINQ